MYQIPTMHSFDSTFTMHNDWSYRSKQLQRLYPQLTEADLAYTSGGENALLKRIEARLNMNRKEAIGLIRNGRMDRA